MITENDVRRLFRFYTTQPVSFEEMGVSHNSVYKIPGEKPLILRVTSDSHRNRRELLSEMDFLTFLTAEGLEVGRPVPSLTNELVTDCRIGDAAYHITAFTFVDGLHWMRRQNDMERLQQIGAALGRLHRCAKSYTPGEGVTPRRSYHENQHLAKAPAIFQAYDPVLYGGFTAFMEQLLSLPRDSGAFGLTHGDFLFSNYHITEDGRVLMFDFDECEYNWYISDLAVCLYYYLIGGEPSALDGKTEEAGRSIVELMTGYLRENHLPAEELRRIGLFFRMRDYILLSTIIGRGETELNGWDRALVDGALERVTGGRPFAGIDIDRIADRLYSLESGNTLTHF